jgi:hypothetical protein
MAHGKLLTVDNLQKHGIVGPSRCVLCKGAIETIQHLFFECPFSIQVWDLLYRDLQSRYSPPSNWNDMFLNLKQTYSSTFIHKPIFKRIWKAVPKFIYWEIWLARNKANFHYISIHHSRVHSLACNLLYEALHAKGINTSSLGQLDHLEYIWVNGILNLNHLSHSFPSKFSPTLTHWKLKIDWRKRQGKIIFFFDGASTGNPGTTSARGVIYAYDGSKVLSFAWGLGHASNNQAEAIAIYMGTKLIE